MTVIITTNEPREVKELFVDRIETPLPFDMLLYTKRFPLPMERKAIPGDLIASVTDGRLQRELIAMREVNPKFQLLILHGTFEFRRNDDLVMPSKHMKVWTKKGIRNLIRSLRVMEGVLVDQAETDRDLVNVVNEWQVYLDTDVHRSLRARPRLESDWFTPTRTERVRYFYEGIKPGISVVTAKALEKRYHNPIDLYAASVENLMQVDGIGRTTAVRIYNFLRGLNGDTGKNKK